jgi:hypothetical protein
LRKIIKKNVVPRNLLKLKKPSSYYWIQAFGFGFYRVANSFPLANPKSLALISNPTDYGQVGCIAIKYASKSTAPAMANKIGFESVASFLIGFLKIIPIYFYNAVYILYI